MSEAFIYRSGGDGYSTISFDIPALQRQNATTLSEARRNLAATTVGNYALFGGGYAGSSATDVVDAYGNSLTRTIPTALSVAREVLASTKIGNYALFGGGYVSSTYRDTVDAYDTSLTRTTPTELSVGRRNLSATSVGNYALFGGGQSGNTSYSDVVDAYSVSNNKIKIYPGTKYSFNGQPEQTSSTWQTLDFQGQLNGYLKIKDTNIN